jgi:hypothetical protein
MRWLAVLMLAACSSESGGGRMLIDASGGAGGGGTSGWSGEGGSGGCFGSGGDGGCGCGCFPDAMPPSDIPSRQTVRFMIQNTSPDDRYVVTGGYYCDAFAISPVGGSALQENVGFQCLCECPNPGGPTATHYHHLRSGDGLTLTWDARVLVTYTEPYDCAAHGFPGLPPAMQLLGVHQPMGPGSYSVTIPIAATLPAGCMAIAGTDDYDCNATIDPMGAPPQAIQLVCPYSAAQTANFDLPPMGDVAVGVPLP